MRVDAAMAQIASVRYFSVRHNGAEVAYLDMNGDLQIPNVKGFVGWVLDSPQDVLEELSGAIERFRNERGNHGRVTLPTPGEGGI